MNQDLPFPIPRTPTPTKPAEQVESPRVRPLVPLCTTHQSCTTGFIGVPVAGCESLESGQEGSRFGKRRKMAEQSCPALDTTIPSDPFGFGFEFGEDVGPLQPLHPHHPDVVCHHDKPCSGRHLLFAFQDSNELVAVKICHRVQVLNGALKKKNIYLIESTCLPKERFGRGFCQAVICFQEGRNSP